MKRLLQKVLGREALNNTITGLADILGFGKKKEVSGKVISSECDAIQPIGISCESTEKVLSHFTSHFSQTNLPQPSLEKGGRDGLQSAPLESEGKKQVPSLFKGRLGWVFGGRKAAFTLAEVFSKHRVTQRLAAFTLAEVLITLGIIGVVAAITMPTLIQNHRKHEIETRLKKVYSTMNQAVALSIANDTWEPSPNPRDAAIVTQWLPKVLVPYLDGVVYPARGINYPLSEWNNSYKMKLKDGSILFFRQGGQLFVGYDINGTKGPNKNGVDLFVFFLSYKNSNKLGYFYPSGYRYEEDGDSYVYGDREKMKEYCGRERSTNCALLIMTDGWRIADDYPVKL